LERDDCETCATDYGICGGAFSKVESNRRTITGTSDALSREERATHALAVTIPTILGRAQ
jgi:hypothetical protein